VSTLLVYEAAGSSLEWPYQNVKGTLCWGLEIGTGGTGFNICGCLDSPLAIVILVRWPVSGWIGINIVFRATFRGLTANLHELTMSGGFVECREVV
jgi:hypothetical protein